MVCPRLTLALEFRGQGLQAWELKFVVGIGEEAGPRLLPRRTMWTGTSATVIRERRGMAPPGTVIAEERKVAR